MWRLSSQDLTCHQKPFYVWEIPFTLVFTCLFPRYFKIVTASLFSVREKGTVTKARSSFVGSLEISSKKSSHWKKPRNFATKIQWPEVGQIPGAGRGYSLTSAICVCTSVARKSTVFQSNLYCKTSIRKKHSRFPLNFVTGPHSSHRNQWWSLKT